MKKLIVDGNNLRHNIEIIKIKAGNARIIAVLKSDGYGLGAAKLASVLMEYGIDFFAVACISEAIALRKAGFENDILLLTSTAVREDCEAIAQYRLTATVGSLEAGMMLSSICRANEKIADVHLEIDTGFGRSGIFWQDFTAVKNAFSCFEGLKITGVYTHLSCAFGRKKYTDIQLQRFLNIKKLIVEDTNFSGIFHIANSAALFKYPETVLDAVRVGSAFTGRVLAGKTGLVPVGELVTDIKEIRWLNKGSNVGYGNAFILKSPKKVAILPVGWGDGVGIGKTRGLFRLRDKARYILEDLRCTYGKNALFGTVSGKKVRLLGRPGLSSMVVDVTSVPEAEVGDKVIIPISPLLVNAGISREYID